MNTLKALLFCVGCLFICFACDSQKSVSVGDAGIIPYLNDKLESVSADRFFSDIEFIPLETNETCLLADVQQVEYRDSLVFVCDNNYRLFLFSETGKFLSQIGREGRGPGEYLGGFRGFFVDMEKRMINIINPTNKSIMVYSFDGTYLLSKEIPLGPYDWGYSAMTVEENRVLIFNSHNPSDNMAYTLLNRDDTKKNQKFLTYDPVKIEDYTYHFATRSMTRFENKIYLTMPLDHIVYRYSNGEIHPQYYIETPSEIIPKNLMQREEGSYLNRLVKFTLRNYFGGFTDIFETNDWFFLHYMAKSAYPGLYVLDKTNNTGSYYLFPSIGEKITSPIFPFSASDGNRIISIVPMSEVAKMKDYIAENKLGDDEVSDHLLNALNKMNEESNPLLVIYDVLSSDL